MKYTINSDLFVMEQINVIAAFDFDGTITTKDTLLEFLKHCFSKTRLLFGLFLLTPVFVLYKIKVLRNDVAKQKIFAHFFKGMRMTTFNEHCNTFSKKIDKIVRDKALERIKYHRKEGHFIVVISASIENWIHPWANENNIDELIATKIEVIGNKLTGKFASKNCHGQEKVRRLKEKISNIHSKYLYAYGDSEGDKQLLSIANKAYYRSFS